MNLTASIYSFLPAPLQDALCSVHGYSTSRLRYHGSFQQYREFLNSADKVSAVDSNLIYQYQLLQIKRIVSYAYRFSPFYSKRFKEIGFHPEDIGSMSDYSQLPFTTKDDVRENHALFFCNPFRLNVHTHSTSGTTGTPLSIHYSEEAVRFQWAVWTRHRDRFSFPHSSCHVNFTGKPVSHSSRIFHNRRAWRHDFFNKQLLIPMQSVTASNIVQLLEMFRKYRPSYLVGYPSIMCDFSSLVHDLDKDHLSSLSSVKYIFTGAESLGVNQKHLLEATFQSAGIYPQYGLTEGVCNASTCELGTYHEDWEFGLLDLCPTDSPNTYEIIGTNFFNLCMPMLRYKTGDLATYDPNFNCSCGRQSRSLLSIEGRIEHPILTPEGAAISRGDYVFKGCHGLKKAQIVQISLSQVVVILRVVNGISKQTLESRISTQFKYYISQSMSVSFDYSREFITTVSGKFMAIVNLVGD